MARLVFLALVLFLAGESSTAAAGKLKVVVSILPQEYFVSRIGGDRLDVVALVKPGSSPATYEPSPKQMTALSQAEIYFRIGVPFKNTLLPMIEEREVRLSIVDTRQGIALRHMEAHHHHHSDAHHAHGGADPHIWLNPRLVKIQARTIADALIDVDPQGKAIYEEGYLSFARDLDALDAKLNEWLAPVRGKSFMVFHPAWGYFADAYGLVQVPIETEGKEPSARQLARIVEKARAEGVRVIFVQPQFSRASANRIAHTVDAEVVSLNALARDYLKNLETIGATVAKALKEQD